MSSEAPAGRQPLALTADGARDSSSLPPPASGCFSRENGEGSSVRKLESRLILYNADVHQSEEEDEVPAVQHDVSLLHGCDVVLAITVTVTVKAAATPRRHCQWGHACSGCRMLPNGARVHQQLHSADCNGMADVISSCRSNRSDRVAHILLKQKMLCSNI